jgi:hypothetical protein
LRIVKKPSKTGEIGVNAACGSVALAARLGYARDG